MHRSLLLREQKQKSFLKAFARSGKVAPAAKAVRISRDAVYDWLRLYPAFRLAMRDAKAVAASLAKRPAFRDVVWTFFRAVRDFIPTRDHARVLVELNITLAQIEFNRGAMAHLAASSRPMVRFPAPSGPGTANPGGAGSRAN